MLYRSDAIDLNAAHIHALFPNPKDFPHRMTLHHLVRAGQSGGSPQTPPHRAFSPAECVSGVPLLRIIHLNDP